MRKINTSSFNTTVEQLISNVNTTLDIINGYNDSLTTKNDSVSVDIPKYDPNIGKTVLSPYTIISYNNLLLQVANMKHTLNSFITGGGLVLSSDGSNQRKFMALPLATAPSKIHTIANPTEFYYKNNWFFEDLIDPKLYIKLDLLDRIDDYADRVMIKRVILVDKSIDTVNWFKGNIMNKNITLNDLYTLLDNNDIDYREDDEVLDFPLANEPYKGSFKITEIVSNNGTTYYTLDNINYSDNYADSPNLYQLSVGDTIKINDNTTFNITYIDVSKKQITITSNIGTFTPKVNDVFTIYASILKEKTLDIPISYNECEIIYLKAVNEYYNLLGNEWSDPISFYTNDLVLKDKNTTNYALSNFYADKVLDYGIFLDGQIREGYTPAFYGMKPNTPILTAEDFKVVQINKQFNSTLDIPKVLEYQKEIVNLKQAISSLKNTINEQKRQLVELTNSNERDSLQQQIDVNINKLSNNTSEYTSISRALLTIAYENNAVLNDPKYRIRGFFPIPAPKYRDNNVLFNPEEIIQFDIAYRYLRLDNTGNALDTFTTTDPSSGQQIKGVYSDWIIVQSPIKSKILNSNKDMYIWETENISDGDKVNISQVDIPIQKGEKVEFKVRSISEAGWPINPLKSDWSNSIIMDFPANLESSNQVSNAINDAKSDEINIQIEETLGSAGLTTHINDSIPNPNSGNGTYFKHQAEFIGIEQVIKSNNPAIADTIKVIDLQTYANNIQDNAILKVYDPSTQNGIQTTLIKIINQLVAANADKIDWTKVTI